MTHLVYRDYDEVEEDFEEVAQKVPNKELARFFEGMPYAHPVRWWFYYQQARWAWFWARMRFLKQSEIDQFHAKARILAESED